MIGRNRVYKGHTAATGHGGAILLFLLALLAIAALAAFSLLPEYLVYYPDGVEMIVPSLREDGKGFTLEGVSAPQPYAGDAAAQLQISAPDYSMVNLGSDQGLGYMQGMYVPFSKVTQANLDSLKNEAERNDIHGLVLQMKDESGMLAWMSTAAQASGFGTNSTWDMAADVAEMKAEGWYLAADISCAVDTAVATHSPELALKDMAGQVYTNEQGAWVDLWSREVREYITDLCADLIDLGFDEIILSHVEHPLSEVGYTREVGASLDRTACAMSFAISLRQNLNETLKKHSAHLCATLEHEALSGGDIGNGQNLEYFLKVFDRVVVKTETYSEDAQAMVALHYDSTLRYVPRMGWIFSGGSWIMDTIG